MTLRVPFSLTAKTISFFANGRMYTLASTSPEFAELRAALQLPADQDHDVDLLVSLCDVRSVIARKSFGEMVFDTQSDAVLWQGKPLQSIWVDKIFEYRALGEPYAPIWNALQRLLRNPTPEAIERLPIFLERTALGFMPDGRFLAFKGVDQNFFSCHRSPDGSRFRHLIGDVCEMPRDQVDADPNQTCSTGLHVGAPGYVKQKYSGASYQLVLCAVGPEDVVAVPTDYNGEKMRVCKYTVISHLAQEYNDELLGSLRGTQSHGYTHQEPVPTKGDARLALLARVDDEVVYLGDGTCQPGTYSVIEIDIHGAMGPGRRVGICVEDVRITDWLHDDKITAIIRDGVELDPDQVAVETEFRSLKAGNVIQFDHPDLGESFGVVTRIDESDEINRVQVRGADGVLKWISGDEFVRLVPEDELRASMVACSGALVQIEGHPVLRDGAYTVSEFGDELADLSSSCQDEGDDEFFSVEPVGSHGNTSYPVVNGTIMVVSFQGEHLWPRLPEGVTMTKDEDGSIYLVSVAGADLRNVVSADKLVGGTITQAKMMTGHDIQVGDLVTLNDGHPPVGVYPVLDVCPTGLIIETEHDGKPFVGFDRVASVTPKA